MIELHWMVIIGFICGILGFLCSAILSSGARADEGIRSMQEINEATELVIEAAIDHGYIEASRSEGDYDLNVSKEGTEKITAILEAL